MTTCKLPRRYSCLIIGIVGGLALSACVVSSSVPTPTISAFATTTPSPTASVTATTTLTPSRTPTSTPTETPIPPVADFGYEIDEGVTSEEIASIKSMVDLTVDRLSALFGITMKRHDVVIMTTDRFNDGLFAYGREVSGRGYDVYFNVRDPRWKKPTEDLGLSPYAAKLIRVAHEFWHVGQLDMDGVKAKGCSWKNEENYSGFMLEASAEYYARKMAYLLGATQADTSDMLYTQARDDFARAFSVLRENGYPEGYSDLGGYLAFRGASLSAVYAFDYLQQKYGGSNPDATYLQYCSDVAKGMMPDDSFLKNYGLSFEKFGDEIYLFATGVTPTE